MHCDGARGLEKWTTAALSDIPDPGTEDGWAYWLSNGESWTDEQRDYAISHYDPAGKYRANADFIASHWKLNPGGERWSCDAFDQVTRLCTAHEERPPVCRDFPWYGREPDLITSLNPQCSYLLDVAPSERPEGARPLIPLTIVRKWAP